MGRSWTSKARRSRRRRNGLVSGKGYADVAHKEDLQEVLQSIQPRAPSILDRHEAISVDPNHCAASRYQVSILASVPQAGGTAQVSNHRQPSSLRRGWVGFYQLPFKSPARLAVSLVGPVEQILEFAGMRRTRSLFLSAAWWQTSPHGRTQGGQLFDASELHKPIQPAVSGRNFE